MTIEITAFVSDLLLSHPETMAIAERLLVDKSLLIGTESQYNEMRDACSDLLQRIGFDENYEPTKEGVALESLIDRLLI
ncbi:hypothetical protein MUG10_14485 [Xanthomonas prunicola]|uniref:Uncharacterized protein n=1 Tax=Xanthomonas prunicola TaxID=2053930 RepID=A0A9Q9IWU3_9XANT|nr:hypothetical protein [Xanthomonas prunicola]USI99286.1 hypothetical protein MUG10_14485 [Xanthomonas prunicola]UXA47708.1 hypothetical protein M0D44_15335 [Xanthomonas prunicola]UXA51562.1 hypothetical protein M0D45_12475 [Xanthomonas prunicola]UXA56170.1 hypothetical protein M0D47_15275 [Xanthomonas prunicola]UXA62142.1 hypothetical protein M0D48_03775 [Xanthomonas prunicola]